MTERSPSKTAAGVALLRAAHQLIDGASVIASLWAFEYEQAGKPSACLDGAPGRVS